ncbi:MAG: acyltransferase [Bacteroidales bacterium]|jgi:hypothetical protein|nr:acyltransferase [Bacteroidales bacterium]
MSKVDYGTFEDIRPYNDDEVPAAVARIAHHPHFSKIVCHLIPQQEIEAFRTQFMQITTITQFQQMVMLRAIEAMVRKSTAGFGYSGFDKLSGDKNYMFIGNHRDILLDAALLQIVLFYHNLDTSEITFGSNLMRGDIVIDIGRLNKMFRIERGGNARDFYNNSVKVSSYMRHTITEKRQSAWIAQRNGRTKNGDDKTEMAVLKMFSLSSNKPFVENLMELNITPLAISYEYEPCDFLKVAELYVSNYVKYVKSPEEDLMSILHGIAQPKGQIALAATDTITREELQQCSSQDKNNRFQWLANFVDRRIYENYKLWKTNYIACDLLQNSEQHSTHYTPNDKKEFIEYMNSGLKEIVGDYEELRTIFLNIYANPVVNAAGLNSQKNK